MKKKLFSILLSLAMVITMMPMATMTALADEPIQVTATSWAYGSGCNEVYVTSNSGVFWFTLEEDLEYGKQYNFSDMRESETYFDYSNQASNATLKVTEYAPNLIHIDATMTVDDVVYIITYDEFAITNGTAETDKDTNHGYISIDKESAIKDETVTVTVKPGEGYALKTLTVVPTEGGTAIETTQDQQNAAKYTFKMPAKAVTVTAEFAVPDEYPVIVNDTKVTSGNASDVLGNTDEGATVKFTPAGTGTNAKLKLSNATLLKFINYTGNDTLDIEVIGENTVSADPQYRPSAIVTWDGNDSSPGAQPGNPNASLNIYGSGSLTVINNKPNENVNHNDGIYANKNLTITGINLTVTVNNTDGTTEYNRDLHAGNDIIIDGAKVKATAGVSNTKSTNAFCAGNDVIIKNGADVTADAGNSTSADSVAIFATHDVKISGSTTKVSATSGQGFNSCGISAHNAVTISGGIVTATAGTATAASVGILAPTAVTISGGKVTAKAGTGALAAAIAATADGVNFGTLTIGSTYNPATLGNAATTSGGTISESSGVVNGGAIVPADSTNAVTAEIAADPATYEVSFPAGPEQVYIIGDTSNWATFTPMTMTSETTATITVDTPFVEYKYCAGADWQYVEKNADGSERSNRTDYSNPDVVAKWAKVPAPSNWKRLTKAFSGEGEYASETEIKDDAENPLFKVKDSNGTRTITLLSDITLIADDKTSLGASSKNVVLDLNGHVLNNAQHSTMTIINANTIGRTITLEDSNTEKLTHKFSVDNGLWVLDEEKGTKTVKGGVITGGGNSCVYVGGTSFIMNGGNICGNTKSLTGGGVDVESNGIFIMNGGSICGNKAGSYGGGVYLSQGGMAVVGGQSVVRGNTAGTLSESNIHLQNNKVGILKVSSDNPLIEGADIGVTVWKSDDWDLGTEVGQYLSDTMADNNCKYFVMNNSGSQNIGKVYGVVKSGEKYVLSNSFTVTEYAEEHGKVTSDKRNYTNGETVTVTVTPENGYELSGNPVVLSADGSALSPAITLTAIGNNKYTFPMPAHAVMIKAEFKKSTEPGPTPGPDPEPTPTPGEPTNVDVTKEVTVEKTETGETTATVDISKKATDIVTEAKEKQSKEVIIDAVANTTEDVDKTDVVIPAKLFEDLSNVPSVENIVIQTNVAELTFDKETAKEIADQSPDGAIITVEAIREDEESEKMSQDVYELKVIAKTASGQRIISDFKGGKVTVKVDIPTGLTGKTVACLYRSDKGVYTRRTITKQDDSQGWFSFTTNHFSDYVVTGESTAQKLLVNQVKPTQNKLKAYKDKKKIRVSFKRATWDKELGKNVTVYQIYRSKKAKKGFKKVKTLTYKKKATTIKYYNKKGLKKGKKYYYKVRGRVKLSNGKYAYTKWSKVRKVRCK